MPFTGGHSPSPERTGGGDAGDAAPRLQRIFESIARRRGKAYDQTDESIVGAENMAFARAIDADVYGANERFANEMNPATATVKGYLPRGERIWGTTPRPKDDEATRQAAVARRMSRFGATNDSQGVRDRVAYILGPLFVDLVFILPSQANTWWPGLKGSAAKITSIAGNQVTVQGLAGVPTDTVGSHIVFAIANANDPNNDGTYVVKSRASASSVVFINNGAPSSPDYGVGGSSGAPTIQWSLSNLSRPWTSTLAHVLVEVDPLGVPGYVQADGTLNAAFYEAVNKVNPELDWLLPADATFDWFIRSSHGSYGWYLDEPNLDLEIFDG